MGPEDADEVPAGDEADTWGLVRISIVAAVCGSVTGFVGGAFRRLLIDATHWRTSLVSWGHHSPDVAWVLPVLMVGACAAVARWIVRLVPTASGSGIQDVEAVWRGDVDFAPAAVVPAKFAGGVLAIGSGLALGREGPTVHMGAVIGSEAGRRVRLGAQDRRVLQAAIGGAGLAVAFNAPLGGSLFVFEEVAKSFRLRLAVVTLIGSAVAIACSRVLLGNHPNFEITGVPTPPGWTIALYVVFGAVTGLLGIAYNRLVLTGLDGLRRVSAVSPEVRAAFVGGLIGLVLWVQPLAVGGGDRLVQDVLDGGIGTSVLLAYLLVRFLVGPVSYSAGTPGGLFAPLLAVGAVWGALVQGVLGPLVPALDPHAGTVAIVGMATFFAAVVRAPFTGIALIVEMTATTTLLVPMLAACFAAVLVTTVVHSDPIYDSLRDRMPAARK